MHIVKMGSNHLPGVAELERLCFSEPWSQNSLELLLRDGAIGFVALEGESVVAYGGMTHVLDEGQITNIATHPSTRRRGFGEQIVRALCDFARERGLGEIFLEVRASNSGAIALYTKLGFERVGERRGFYRAPLEDAVIMKINLQ